MTSQLDRLGRRVAGLEELVRDLARQPRLANSSIEGGGVDLYNSDGTLTGRVGEQWDGSSGSALFNGPPPPQPASPFVDPVINGLKVRYDGTFTGGPFIVVPMDFSHFEVHVSTDPNMSGLLFATLKGTINTARGGEVLIDLPSDQEYYVCVVARSLAGKASVPSPTVGPFRPDKIATADLGFDIEELAGSTISRGPDEPVDPRYGDLWLKTPENIPHQWTPNPDHWEPVRDAGVSQAINDAFEAQGIANDAVLSAGQAQSLAEAANQLAGEASEAALAAGSAAALAQSSADSKVTVYRQDSAPTGGTYRLNDLWLDTDDNNRLYAWSGGTWLLSDDQRIATALTTASTAQSTAGAKTTLFAQTSQPSTAGRVTGDTWIDTDDGNKVYVWTSAWTATLFGAPAISATARQLGALTIYRQASQPASGMLTGDYWIDSDDNKPHFYNGTTWVVSQDAEINSAVQAAATAQATADGKVRVFSQASPPTGLGEGDVDDLWIDTDAGNRVSTWSGAAWVPRQVGNDAIEPNSLIASTVLATGSITAPLLQTILVLASAIIAGDPAASHARMDPNGFRVFMQDLIDNIPNEVVRMGTDTNDFFAIINAAKQAVFSVDDTGGVAGRRAVFDSISLGGSELGELLQRGSRGVISRFFQYPPGGQIGLIYTPYGIADLGAPLEAGRTYRIDWGLHFTGNQGGDEVGFKIRYTKGTDNNLATEAPAPTINSTEIGGWVQSVQITDRWEPASQFMYFTPAVTSRYRFLLTAERGQPGTALGTIRIVDRPVQLVITDVGPVRPDAGVFSGGGGTLYVSGGGGPSTPPPASSQQEYVVELAPAGWASYRGDGSQRTDVGGPVQGWDPSGFNGDGGGFWYFNMPNITGWVNWVDFYCYSEHWYYNSGGTAIFNMIPGGVGSNFSAFKLAPGGDWHVGGFPKPGGKRVGLPTDWRPYFRNGGTAGGNPGNRAVGISVGRAGNTNLVHYGRFQGGSARLIISYTQ